VAPAFEHERLDRHDAIASAHGRCGVSDDLLSRVLCDGSGLYKEKA
jgi:hypothetical protein